MRRAAATTGLASAVAPIWERNAATDTGYRSSRRNWKRRRGEGWEDIRDILACPLDKPHLWLARSVGQDSAIGFNSITSRGRIKRDRSNY